MSIHFVENDATNREENAHIRLLLQFTEGYFLDKFNRLILICFFESLLNPTHTY